MSAPMFELLGVGKSYSFFKLEGVHMQLAPGQIMGFIGANGAGKSTTIRILMGLIPQDRGEVRLLGHAMPEGQALAKRDVAFASEEMRLYSLATVEQHMQFVASVVPHWDARYAELLLRRFNLHPQQKAKELSHGQRMKATNCMCCSTVARL